MAGIQRIGNVFYRAPDLEAAVRFYTHVLGLSLKFRDGDRWAAFDVGGMVAEPVAEVVPVAGLGLAESGLENVAHACLSNDI